MSGATSEPRAPGDVALIRRLLGLAWHYRGGCIRVLILQLLLLTMGLAGLGLLGVGVDYIKYEWLTSGAAAPLPPDAAPPKPPQWPLGIDPPAEWSRMDVVGALALAILLLAAVRGALSIAYTFIVAHLIHAQIVVNLRSAVYRKMQRLSFRFFDANASGGIINRVTRDVQHVRMFVDGVVVQGLILLLSTAVYLVYMARIHSGLTLACMATTPFLWISASRFSALIRPAYRRSRELFDTMVMALSENIQGVHVVKGFARQKEELARFRRASEAVRDQNMSIFGRVSVFQPLIGFLTQLNLVVLLAYGGVLAIRFEQAPDLETASRVGLSVGQLLVFAGLLQQFSAQVTNIANITNTIQQCLTAARRVFEVLDAPEEISAPPTAHKVGRARGHVRFEDVSFAYTPQDPVLQGVDFEAQPGQCIAIVGALGSGKSTVLSLIPRFYDPTRGRVLLDGVDLRDIELDSLRRNIGMVFQESFLFSSTVADNIAFGDPEAGRDAIERAARIASAHDFIMDLPKQYDTVLHEAASDLSGGQRQRLALARAVLLEPPILLLDDPLAAVDPGTEEDILAALDSAMKGRTTFIVAHRLSTLRRANLVVVLENGRVVDVGTHGALMQSDSHYSRAAALQSADRESRKILRNGEDGGRA